jgi:hypothetical protein
MSTSLALCVGATSTIQRYSDEAEPEIADTSQTHGKLLFSCLRNFQPPINKNTADSITCQVQSFYAFVSQRLASLALLFYYFHNISFFTLFLFLLVFFLLVFFFFFFFYTVC